MIPLTANLADHGRRTDRKIIWDYLLNSLRVILAIKNFIYYFIHSISRHYLIKYHPPFLDSSPFSYMQILTFHMHTPINCNYFTRDIFLKKVLNDDTPITYKDNKSVNITCKNITKYAICTQ